MSNQLRRLRIHANQGQPFLLEPLDTVALVDEFDALMVNLRRVQSQVVSGFYEEEIPTFEQGVPTHELQEVVTAKEVAGYINHIIKLRKALEYWMPDETLVLDTEQKVWEEHIALLQKKK